MSDGAHLGVSADRALKTVIGGEDQPTEDEERNPEQMREWLLGAPTVDEFATYCETITDYSDDDYGQCARVAARVILEAFLAEPRLALSPTETTYDWDSDPDRGAKGMKPEFVIQRSLSIELRERNIVLPEGMSGFQWGWAVNAARYCVELPPAPNPAIMTIGG